MSPELMMWFVLATKMAVTALFVTAATIIAERLGATVGALVATLPVSAGPVYVFLALDHDSTFISSSAAQPFVPKKGWFAVALILRPLRVLNSNTFFTPFSKAPRTFAGFSFMFS